MSPAKRPEPPTWMRQADKIGKSPLPHPEALSLGCWKAFNRMGLSGASARLLLPNRNQPRAPINTLWNCVTVPCRGSVAWAVGMLSNHCSDNYRIIESKNHLGWKRRLRRMNPNFNPALTRPPLNHVPECHFRDSDSTTSCSNAWPPFQWRNFSQYPLKAPLVKLLVEIYEKIWQIKTFQYLARSTNWNRDQKYNHRSVRSKFLAAFLLSR